MRRKEQNLSVRITRSCVIFLPSALPFGSAATVLTVSRNQTTPRDVKFLCPVREDRGCHDGADAVQ